MNQNEVDDLKKRVPDLESFNYNLKSLNTDLLERLARLEGLVQENQDLKQRVNDQQNEMQDLRAYVDETSTNIFTVVSLQIGELQNVMSNRPPEKQPLNLQSKLYSCQHKGDIKFGQNPDDDYRYNSIQNYTLNQFNNEQKSPAHYETICISDDDKKIKKVHKDTTNQLLNRVPGIIDENNEDICYGKRLPSNKSFTDLLHEERNQKEPPKHGFYRQF